MRPEIIDRKELKRDARERLSTAQVSPKGMTALYMALALALATVDNLAGGGAAVADRNILGIFVYVLTMLVTNVLAAGYLGYILAIRRGERAEYLSLFDGFSLAGKVIALSIIRTVFTALWSMLFVIPGIVAMYRYRFAIYNLLENPSLSAMEALEMSKRQTRGYKGQLFTLDLSYFFWSLLSLLPTLVWGCYTYAMVLQAALSENTDGMFQVFSADFGAFLGIPVALWMVLFGLWNLVVCLFYLPSLQCTDLGYFEVAKSTSGVGLNPREEDPEQGPDNLGGWGGL